MGRRDEMNRRNFLRGTAAGTVGLLALGVKPAALLADEPKKDESPAKEILPVEDLMREHGVLRRVLLAYEEIARRLDADKEFPPAALTDSADIVRKFIQDYHEKLEEEFLFPRFRKPAKLSDLVETLLAQHQAGRKVTEAIIRAGQVGKPEERKSLADLLRQFIRMYRPHAAREDTVLFPAFHEMLSAKEYEELGDTFEDKERELFGEGGFGKVVDRVAGIEKRLGIEELAQFTPKVAG
jgi:hemerythrin-like domain-containing protein